MRAVQLGCGRSRIPGVLGLDVVPLPGPVDAVCDLDRGLCLRDGSVDEVHAYHVLEHCADALRVMEDVHRALRPGGVAHVRVPHFSSLGAWTDITHVRPFGWMSFDVFTESDPRAFYSAARFEIVARRIKYFGDYPNGGVYERHVCPNRCPRWARPLVRALDAAINAWPAAFERLWCYWVGGATEVCFTLRKRRPHRPAAAVAAVAAVPTAVP